MFEIVSGKDPQKALQKAHEYIREDRKQAAIDILEDNITDDPESFELFQELARLYYDNDERANAIDVLRRAQGLVPSRTDEVIAELSELFYQHTSIDAGQYLVQLYTAQQKYDDISKILQGLNEHEVELLIRKYEKLTQNLEKGDVVAKADIDNAIILASLKYRLNASEEAMSVIEPLVAGEAYKKQLLNWGRIMSRERYSDPQAALLLLRMQLGSNDYEGALTQAQRIFDKFPEISDQLIDVLAAVQPPPALQSSYTQMLTDLYITKGDLETSIEQLQQMLELGSKDVDTIIRDLRKLELVNPKDIKVLYTLADAYIRAQRVSLAINELDKIFELDADQYEEVLRRYRQALEVKGNDPLVMQGLVNLYLKKDDTDAAVDVVEAVFRQDPGLLNEFIYNLTAILEKDIDNVRALDLIGTCYARKGDRESALLIFQQLLDKEEYRRVSEAAREMGNAYPHDAQYANLRATSLALLGANEEALQAALDFLEAEPDQTAQLLPALDLIVSKAPQFLPRIEPIYRKYHRTDPFVAELAMARAHAYAGEYRKAVSAFERCLKDDERRDVTKRAIIEVLKEKPDAVPLLLTAARIYMSEGEMDVATQFFKTAQRIDPEAFFEIINEFYDAIKSFPKGREARTLLVETFYSRGMWDRVIEESRRAVEVFEKDAQYFNLKLGQALVETGNLSDAVRPLMISLEGEEDYSQEVIEYLDRILKTDKSNVPAHFARGRALSRAGHVEEAVDEYLLTAKILPARAGHVLAELKTLASKVRDHPKVLYALGFIGLGQKKYESAIRDLARACELDKSYARKVIPQLERLQKKVSNPALSFALAKMYCATGARRPAIALFALAQSQEKKYREPVITEMKKICEDSKQDTECRKQLAEIYFNYHNWEDILTLFGDIYRLDQQEGPWIKEFIGRILEADLHAYSAYYFLARILMDEGAYGKAVEVYKKVVEMAPAEAGSVIQALSGNDARAAEVGLFLSDLYIDNGYGREAVEVLDRILSQDPAGAGPVEERLRRVIDRYPEIGESYLLQGRIHGARGDFEGAIHSIERAIELMPGREDVVIRLGQLLHEVGEVERAVTIFTELLSKTSDRNTIYRLIRTAREDYYKEKLAMLRGDEHHVRLERAHIYLLIDRLGEAEDEIKFEATDKTIMKRQACLKARLALKKRRPLDALDIIQAVPLDKDTAETYADVYEALGSFGTAVRVLRQAGVEGMEQRIRGLEKLAQSKRATKGKYFVEGRT